MAVEIKVPDIGTTVDRVKLVQWRVREGDTVKRGDVLCEVETDKAVSELESVAAGTVLRIVSAADSEVGQGDVIAYVGEAGEEIPAGGHTAAAGPQGQVEAVAPGPERAHRGAGIPLMIRNLARRHGVDPGTVAGTGPGGRITRDDVLTAASGGTETTQPALSANQRAVGEMVSRSREETVPFDLVCRIDMSAANRRRATAAEGWQTPLDSVFIHAVSRILREFPGFMSRLDGDRLAVADSVNIAFVVGLRKGLYTLVVADADTKTLPEIDEDVKTLAFRAARGRSTPLNETARACFTISNLSMYPVHAFNAVIPQGQSAVLAIGAVEDTPVIREGRVTAAPMSCATLTVDHRLINGREAGRFIARLKEVLEA